MSLLSLSDLRVAARSLARTPGFAITVAATFALGIGVNLTVFSAAWAALLAPLPFERPDRLVSLGQSAPSLPSEQVAPANFLDWRREAASLESAAAWFLPTVVLEGGVEPREIEVAQVSTTFFDVLGVEPRAGRFFHQGESGALAVVSEGFWRDELGGEPVAGRTVLLNGEAWELVGVAPASLEYPAGAELWTLAERDVPPFPLPMEVDVTQLRNAQYLGVVARLADGVALDAARAELDALAARLRAEYPEEIGDVSIVARPLAAQLGAPAREPLALLAAAGACVLLVACFNVAGLLVARGLGRSRELAVSAALGAKRSRLVARPLAEALVLAAVGTLGGLAFAGWATGRLLAALPPTELSGRSPAVGATAVLVAVGLGVLSAVAAALAPALSALRSQPAAALAGGRTTVGAGSRWTRGGLVSAQTALALVLVTGALLLGRTLAASLAVDPGFEADDVVAMSLVLPGGDAMTGTERRAVLARAVDAAATVPGVLHAGGVQRLPLTGFGLGSSLSAPASDFPPDDGPSSRWRTVAGDYFEALGIPLRRGRLFDARDGAGGAPAAIVNESLARHLWPGDDPIGQQVRTGIDGDDVWLTVVGVVGDTPATRATEAAPPELFRPLAQPNRYDSQRLHLAVRTGPGFSLAALRESLRGAAPRLVIGAERPLDELLSDATRRERVVGRLVAAFGALALLLAGIGLYGVLALWVGERRRELGLRLAVGARPSALAVAVLRLGAGHVLAGVAIGAVAALALGRLLRGWLWGVEASDPWSLGGAIAVLLAVAALASLAPALRALRLDPAAVLRDE